MEIKETEEFSKWLKGFRDARAKAKVVANGNPGDVGPVGDGISELWIDFGPGYRVYLCRAGGLMSLSAVATSPPRPRTSVRRRLWPLK
jgi:putative addiction module killer protein